MQKDSIDFEKGKMTTRLLLSIIIPVYNVERYIANCLRSIFVTGADPDGYEVIVVNDGTQDRSMDIVKSVCSERDNVTIVEQKNQGLSAARMAGVVKAKGEYIWFIDSDDWLLPGGVSTVFSLLEKYPRTDVFSTPLLWVKKSGESHLDYSYKGDAIQAGTLVLKERYIPAWASPRYIIRRELFANSHLFFPIGLVHEDDYFGRVLLYLAKTVYISNQPVYAYRQRDGSITDISGIRSAQHILHIHELLISFCHSSVSDIDKRWFENSSLRLIRTSFTRNEKLYRTKEFKSFRRKNLKYILKEYKKYGSVLSASEMLSDISLFLFPVFRTRLYYLLNPQANGE